jgi:hypothetical protein
LAKRLLTPEGNPVLHPDQPDTATPFASRARRLASLCVLTLTVGAGGVALAAVPATASTVSMPAAATAAPSAPLHVTASQTGVGQVTIRWSAPTSAGSSAITGYDVGYSAGEWGNGEGVLSTARSDVFKGLANGAYSFSVAAVNNKVDMGQRVFVPVTVTGLRTPTQTVSRTTVTAGDALTVSGLASPGARLTLDRALPGQPFRPLATVIADSRGHYARTITVANTATYRSRGVTGLLSHANKVVAQDRMTFGAVRNAFRTYTLSGKVYPARKGQLVKLSYLSGSSYTALASVSTDQYGRWSYKHTYNFTKTYTFKAVSAATTLNASKAVTLKVAVK